MMLIEKTRQGILNQVLQTERRQIKAMAYAWLSSGAKCFCVVDETGEVLSSWPHNPENRCDGSSAEIIVARKPLGQLIISGISGEATTLRLEADASMIARFCSFESDINSMVEELIDAQDQILALYRLTQSVRGLLEIRETMEILALEAIQLVKVESAFLVLEAGEKTIVQHPANFLPTSLLNIALEIVEKDQRELHISEPDTLRGVKNLFLIPIMIRNQMVAGLGLIDKAGGFTSPDMKKARAIAEEAGAQIEKVLLYQETLNQARLRTELDMAADIQTRLLPQHIPAVDGLDIAGASIQARQVGGDFFDYITKPGQSFVFNVGDVAGKGMSSALLMAMTRTVIRSYANTFSDPGQILTLANFDLYEDYTGVGKFTTTFVGAYLAESQTMKFANAGQSPVIYCPFDGDPQLLQAADMPVGILPDNQFTSESLSFRPGDVLIVATDGFSEAESTDEGMFGYERLLSLVKSLSHQSADNILQALFRVVKDFSKNIEQSDDQTLVVIKGK